MLGAVSASVFALFVNSISLSFGGLGDEILGASIVLLTAFLISWTVVWMQGYSHKIREDLSKLSNKIKAGAASKLMLVIVVSVTILREGAEIILFVYSISSVENITGNNYLLGLAIGAISGLAIGIIIYKGLMRYTGQYVFLVSTIWLTLIAAGLAAEAAGILTSSGIIEIYNDQLWNSSWLVSDQSAMGKILKVIIGYDARPNGLQLIFYVSTIMLTVVMMKMKSELGGKKHV
jgi:high-affinity iron transporter